MFKVQHIDASTVYDSLKLACNTVDQTSMSKVHTIDMLASSASKNSSRDVYATQEMTDNDVMYDNALTANAVKTNT